MPVADDGASIVPQARASSLPATRSPGLFVSHEVNRTGFVYDVRMMLHNDGMDEHDDDRHPERPKRISVVYEALQKEGVLQRMRRLPMREATRSEILLVHPPSLLTKMDQIEAMLMGEDAEAALLGTRAYYESLSLYVHPSTSLCARLSCGGVIESTMAVATGVVRNSFAIVRPPGHHAEPDEHMGFCFFNNVAVATRVVLQRTSMRRILILDWDVHHGNGTQSAFYDDPSVLYISLHRYEGGNFYPGGTGGGMDKCGTGEGKGRNVNIPWPTGGMGDGDYIHAFQKLVLPIAYEFGPELVMISAGFDAAEGDQLGGCHVSPACFAHMTHMLSVLAGGKLVVALEGGYNLQALSQSALAVGETLIGESPPELPPLVASEGGTETVWQVAHYQSQFWRCINPKGCEPKPDEDNVYSIPQVLKAHRARDLAQQFELFSIPFADPELQARFGDQVLSTPYLFEEDATTIVLFVHDFGNLRVELESGLASDINMEHSYLVDASRHVVDWANSKRYGLIDVNILTNHIFEDFQPLSGVDVTRRVIRKLILYLWDNYVDLTPAKNIILIGHGTGCRHVIDLLHDRALYLDNRIKAVLQVNGMNTIPLATRDDDDLRRWYHKNSVVVLPARHPLNLDPTLVLRRHGKIVPSTEEKAAKVLDWAVTHVLKEIVDPKINPSALPAAQVSVSARTVPVNGNADVEML
ncbi:Arginase/deacetylase [Calocera viscosa TUFC12733]|uniref:histone deacetylase n=1 Tax=Calocera viscosa (strain TUFC12733) TaxID=1330018 RepID=A0A167IXQ8_CALVF|nr:Arginase/deacetylase [Calocera viscosa TUFC12733]